MLLLMNPPVTFPPLSSTFRSAGRPTAGASAAGVLRPEPQQAKHANLTATPLAGRDYRQVYHTCELRQKRRIRRLAAR
ncbi:MAG TPA: hypothetical protein VJG32_03200 [Anaerolineae bacterium]|nr:hypothetical protein [Anaerolineae bacterium]